MQKPLAIAKMKRPEEETKKTERVRMKKRIRGRERQKEKIYP